MPDRCGLAKGSCHPQLGAERNCRSDSGKTPNLLRLFPAPNDRRRFPDHVFLSADGRSLFCSAGDTQRLHFRNFGPAPRRVDRRLLGPGAVAQRRKVHLTRTRLVEQRIRLHAAAPLFPYLTTARQRGARLYSLPDYRSTLASQPIYTSPSRPRL